MEGISVMRSPYLVFTFVTVFGIISADGAIAQEAPQSEGLRKTIEVDKNATYKAVYDIKENISQAGIGKALYYARGLLEAFKGQGVSPKQLDIHLVLHGDAAHWLLKDETYQVAIDDPFAVNPHDKVVNELLEHGVHVEICQVTMKAKGWKPEDVLPGVKIVHDGYTRLIQLQNKGYAYVGF